MKIAVLNVDYYSMELHKGQVRVTTIHNNACLHLSRLELIEGRLVFMSQRNWNLPEGVTLAMLDEYARERENAARRASYARHPERVLRQRLTSAANLLTRHGLIDVQTRAAILQRVGGVAK